MWDREIGRRAQEAEGHFTLTYRRADVFPSGILVVL
jgi:hypothetical protein